MTALSTSVRDGDPVSRALERTPEVLYTLLHRVDSMSWLCSHRVAPPLPQHTLYCTLQLLLDDHHQRAALQHLRLRKTGPAVRRSALRRRAAATAAGPDDSQLSAIDRVRRTALLAKVGFDWVASLSTLAALLTFTLQMFVGSFSRPKLRLRADPALTGGGPKSSLSATRAKMARATRQLAAAAASLDKSGGKLQLAGGHVRVGKHKPAGRADAALALATVHATATGRRRISALAAKQEATQGGNSPTQVDNKSISSPSSDNGAALNRQTAILVTAMRTKSEGKHSEDVHSGGGGGRGGMHRAGGSFDVGENRLSMAARMFAKE